MHYQNRDIKVRNKILGQMVESAKDVVDLVLSHRTDRSQNIRPLTAARIKSGGNDTVESEGDAGKSNDVEEDVINRVLEVEAVVEVAGEEETVIGPILEEEKEAESKAAVGAAVGAQIAASTKAEKPDTSALKRGERATRLLAIPAASLKALQAQGHVPKTVITIPVKVKDSNLHQLWMEMSCEDGSTISSEKPRTQRGSARLRPSCRKRPN